MWDKIETYIVVTVISALIWLYAEGETVKTYEGVPAQVQFVAPPGQDLLIEPAGVIPVRMSVRASASQYTQLKRLLDDEGPIRLLVDDTHGLERVESIIDRLSTDAFNDLSVTILTADPATVSLRTQKRVEVTVPVEVAPGDLRLSGSPSYEPTHATIRVPADAVERVRDQKAQAALSSVSGAANWEPNVPQEVSVPLTLPEPVPGTEITPSQVRVRFTIERRTTSVELPRVPLFVSAPPSVFERFDILVPEESRFVRNVVLKGPADAIARIESGDYQVAAFLVFTNSDELRGADRKLPELRLPQGVTADSALERIEYQAIRRSTPTPATFPELNPAFDPLDE